MFIASLWASTLPPATNLPPVGEVSAAAMEELEQEEHEQDKQVADDGEVPTQQAAAAAAADDSDRTEVSEEGTQADTDVAETRPEP